MVKDFLSFRRMLMPLLLQVFFWLSVVICVATSIVNFVQQQWLNGLQVLILGPILARIFCEFFILFFRMNESLTDIRNQLQKRN